LIPALKIAPRSFIPYSILDPATARQETNLEATESEPHFS